MVKVVDLGKWLDSERKVLDAKIRGRSLVDLTSYQRIAYWWFVRFRLYHAVEANRVAELFLKSHLVFSVADFLYDFFTSYLCRFVSFFLRSRTKNGEGNSGLKVLVFASNSGWREIREPGGRVRRGDAMLDSVLREMKRRRHEIVTVSQLKYSISAVKIMIERLKVEGVVHVQSNGGWSMKTWVKEYYAKKHFRKVWTEILEKDEDSVAMLRNHPLVRELQVYFNSLFSHVFKQIELAENIVEKQAPDVVFLTSEYGFFERGLVVAGKLRGIPVLALQHGNIGPLHEGYVYPENSISPLSEFHSPYCPVPDKTAVYGPFYHNVLTEFSCYPQNTVVVTGQPRYDRLVKASNIFGREAFCAKLGLNPLEPIVLVATQGWPLREKFARKVLEALKGFPQAQVVLKPHPREDSEFYRKIVAEENVKAKVLSKRFDTIEALYSCDLLIAAFSTVITEALVLGKPVVTLNLTVEDPAPYYRRVTLRLNREDDLAEAVSKALYSKKTREELRVAREKFVFNHAYKQDGKATLRVVNLVEQLVKE